MRAVQTLLLVLALAVVAGELHAGGPLTADGSTGRRYASGSFPLTYRVDQGTLGNFSNATATSIVVYAFWEWDSIRAAALSFTNGTQLARDVTLATDAYISGGGQWSDGVNPMVFDTDGSITDARLGTGAKNSVLGFAGSAWTGTTFSEGFAIINGFLSGTGTTTDEDRYKATITHEVGHFLGLGHSQVTMHADFATMYPIIQKTAQKNISPDDTAAMAWLYPATGHAANVGAISGTVRTSASTNLGNVVVLAIDSATGATYSTVVDYFSGGNTSFTNPPTASGSYTIAGLPPGRYFVRIEPPKSEFSGGSSLASYSTPTNTTVAREWYNGPSESGDMLLDDQNQKTGVAVTANSTTTGINFVANESATLSTLAYHNTTASRTWPLPFGSYTGYAVRFTSAAAGSLLGVKVRTEAGSVLPLTGTLTVTVHANATGGIAGIPGTTLGSVTIPFSDLSTNQDNEIWLRSLGTAVNFASGSDFHVALTSNGTGSVVFASDNGATTQNRTSYYTSANGWRNMPTGMTAGTPGYNLHMSAIYTTTLAGNPTPAISLTPTTNDFGRARPNTTVDKVLTVANTGTASLSVTSSTFTGTDASAFSIVSGGAPFTVAQNGTHQITVRFTSLRGGSAQKTAALSLVSNAPTSPTSASLTGLVIDPVATKMMASIDFGSRRMDSTHVASFTVLRNTGNDTLNISSLSLGGADGGGAIRILSSTAASRLAPDSTLTVRLQITPNARSAFNASLVVNHDDSTASTTFSVTGTGVAPLIALSKDSLDHGSIRVQSEAFAELWVRNTGNATMSVLGFAFIGADSTAFQILSPNTLPKTVAAGDSMLVRVRFSPAARRAYRTVVRMRTDAIPATVDMTLVGRGLAPVVFAPSLAVIGSAPLGGSVESTVGIRNIGDASMTVGALTLGGAHAAEYRVVGPTVPATVAPGDSLVVRVRLEPTTAGTRSADLIVSCDDPQSSTVQIALAGSGLQGQLSRISGSRIDFGDVTIATMIERELRLANSGSAALTITSMGSAGSSAFVVAAPSLPLTLQPGDSLSVPVRFLPTATGAANALVTITSNGMESSVEVQLAGRGVAPGLALSRSAIAFGSVPTNQTRIDSFIVRNTGAMPLNDVVIALNGGAEAAFEIVSATGPFVIAAGESQSVVVRLRQQSSAGALASSVRVTAAGGALSDVALTANIVESMLTTAASIDFGTVVSSASTDTSFVLRNSGGSALRIDSIVVRSAKDGVSGGYFVASIATPVTIPAGSEETVTLRFNPSAGAGAYAGVLTVYTDNPPDSAFTIVLSGALAAPSGVSDAVAGLSLASAVRPNPTSTSAYLTVRTPSPTHLAVVVTDLRGRVVARPYEGVTSGEESVRIDASRLAAGEYLIVVRTAAGVATRRMTVVR